jgi:hypothetical protein
MRPDVEVTQREPRPADAVRTELAAHPLGFADPSPAAHLIALAGKRVHDGIEVGCDPQPAKPHVVARVHHRGDGRGAATVAIRVGLADVGANPAQEARATDAAGNHRDLHCVTTLRDTANGTFAVPFSNGSGRLVT